MKLSKQALGKARSRVVPESSEVSWSALYYFAKNLIQLYALTGLGLVLYPFGFSCQNLGVQVDRLNLSSGLTPSPSHLRLDLGDEVFHSSCGGVLMWCNSQKSAPHRLERTPAQCTLPATFSPDQNASVLFWEHTKKWQRLGK